MPVLSPGQQIRVMSVVTVGELSFTARRYASGICCRCVTVCPSQAGIVSKRLDGSSSSLSSFEVAGNSLK